MPPRLRFQSLFPGFVGTSQTDLTAGLPKLLGEFPLIRRLSPFLRHPRQRHSNDHHHRQQRPEAEPETATW